MAVLYQTSIIGMRLAARSRTWSPTFAESCDFRFHHSEMARVERFELPAHRFEACCSSVELYPHGAAYGTRTRGLDRDEVARTPSSSDAAWCVPRASNSVLS